MTAPQGLADDLLPCPFCGGTSAYVMRRTCDKNTPYDPADRAFPVVRCKDCYVEVAGDDWGAPPSAIAAWNRRAAIAGSTAPPAAQNVPLTDELSAAAENVLAGWYALATALPQDDRIESLEWGAMQRLRAALKRVSTGIAAPVAQPGQPIERDGYGPRTPLRWPKEKHVGRCEDMSPEGHLRVVLDSDNDAIVAVFDGRHSASVEFCNGGGGGGKSPRTREALIALMVAMEADNADSPAHAFPPTAQPPEQEPRP